MTTMNSWCLDCGGPTDTEGRCMCRGDLGTAEGICHVLTEDRTRAKEVARQKDQSDLNENHVSAQDLRIKNSFVKGVDFSRAALNTKGDNQ